MGKRKKIAGAKFWLKTAAWLAFTACLVAIGLDFKTAAAVLLLAAGLIAFIATEVNEHPYESWDDEDGDGSTGPDRKSTRLNSSHLVISYAVFCLKKKTR